MYKVAARPVRAETNRMKGAAQLRLVLGVSSERAQLASAVRELALVPVLAGAVFFEGAAELRLVARSVYSCRGRGGRRGLRLAAVQLAVRLGLRGLGAARRAVRVPTERVRAAAVDAALATQHHRAAQVGRTAARAATRRTGRRRRRWGRPTGLAAATGARGARCTRRG